MELQNADIGRDSFSNGRSADRKKTGKYTNTGQVKTGLKINPDSFRNKNKTGKEVVSNLEGNIQGTRQVRWGDPSAKKRVLQ